LLVVGILFFYTSSYTQIVTTYAGNGYNGDTGNDGLATQAGIPYPYGICLDSHGNLYIVVSNGVRKVDAITGIISQFAGTKTFGFTGDGGPAIEATLESAFEVCADAQDNIYISEYAGHRIRKVNATTGIITTIAGTGIPGFSGDGNIATSAQLNTPESIAIDKNGNLFIADTYNGKIRKVNLGTGIISTVAGNGSEAHSGDGGLATNAGVPFPTALCFDSKNDMYIAEVRYPNTSRLRKVNMSTGIITTIAGSAAYAHSGDGGLAINADLLDPNLVCVDAQDNIYLVEYDATRIRKIDAATGIITTFAGLGVNGFGGDCGAAATALFNLPRGICVRNGEMFISDCFNHRIRKIVLPPQLSITASSSDICSGSTVTFTANLINGGINPIYQWLKNNELTGTNSPTYTGSFNVNDIVKCISYSSGCVSLAATSNSITMQSRNDVQPEVNISSSHTEICSGTEVTFTATNKSGNVNPSYQWSVNGINVGNNSTSYTASNLNNNAIIQCRMTVPQCGSGTTKDDSNPIVIKVNSPLHPLISINTSNPNFCTGSVANFTATAIDAGSNPVYQWKVNDVKTGSNSPHFNTSSLSQGDIVRCELTIEAVNSCTTQLKAESNLINVNVINIKAPTISISASGNNICEGEAINFTALVENAIGTPSYQWIINQRKTGTDQPSLSTKGLANGDEVSCIFVSSNNVCGVLMDTSNIVTVQLRSLPVISISPVDTTVMVGTQVKLATSITGTISSFSWTPSNELINANTISPVTTPMTTTTKYTLNVEETSGCKASKQVVIKVQNKLFIPNSFTPNGDGLNDVFRIPAGVALDLAELAVFDRWGNKLFTTNNISKGWNGKSNGVLLSTNVYVYTIRGRYEGKDILLKGTVLLIQ
jgi:gliding motility-associated-like protein